jgi:hypothetical protein
MSKVDVARSAAATESKAPYPIKMTVRCMQNHSSALRIISSACCVEN